MRRVLWISLDVFGKFMDSDFELFWGRDFVGWVDKSLGCLRENTRDILKQERKKIRKKGNRKLLKRYEIDSLMVVKSWNNAETFILVWLRAILSCGGLKYVYQLMTEITGVGDIKLEVMSTDVEGKQKCKRHNEQLTWEWKK